MSDGSAFSTDNAIVDSELSEMSLDERFLFGDYDKHHLWREDDETQELTHLGIHLRDWQLNSIRRLINSWGTSKYKALRKLWMHGIATLDNEMEIPLWPGVTDHVSLMDSIVNGSFHDDVEPYKRGKIASIDGSDDPVYAYNDLAIHGTTSDKLQTMVIPDQKSRIQDEFMFIAGLGGWFHRGLVSVGLSDSDRITAHDKKRADDMMIGMIRSINSSTWQIQDNVVEYLGRARVYWEDNGAPVDVLEDAMLMADFGNQGTKDTIRYIVEGIRNDPDVDVVGPEVHGRQPFLLGPDADNFPDAEEYYSWM